MDDNTKRKLLATGKVIAGFGRMVSGTATGLGVGIVGSFLKSHHMRGAAVKLAKTSLEGGKSMLENGWKELHQ